MKKRSFLFHSLLVMATISGLIFLAVLIIQVFRDGIGSLDWHFITSFPSRFPDQAGIKSALFGTLWLMVLTALFSFSIGVGAAIYLEEYAPNNWFVRIIQINVANLAGVPSVVYGILGLVVFVRFLSLDRSLIAGALTIATLILPIIIVASQEAIKAVPDSHKQAAYALGATRWQTIWRVLLPDAFPGILTGAILALSRGIGETAPLIMIGALTFIAFTPGSPFDPFTVLPIQIFNWTSRPQEEFRDLAAAGIILMLAALLLMNSGAIWLRNKYQRRFDG